MRVNSRIVTASAFGLLMVVGSFFLSKNQPSENIEPLSEGSVTETRNFIKITDSDSDSIPDWQDTLDIPTINLDETRNGNSSTKTAALAVALGTHSIIGAATSSLLEIGQSLTTESLDEQYTSEDILVSEDNSQAALRKYGNRVAEITFEFAPPPGTENELTLLNRALTRKDALILSGLEPTIVSYEGMVAAMLATPVPSNLVREHLSLINVYNALHNDASGFQMVFEDALLTMMRLRRYQADSEALYLAISNLYKKLDQSGIQWTQSDTVSRFIVIEKNHE